MSLRFSDFELLAGFVKCGIQVLFDDVEVDELCSDGMEVMWVEVNVML